MSKYVESFHTCPITEVLLIKVDKTDVSKC